MVSGSGNWSTNTTPNRMKYARYYDSSLVIKPELPSKEKLMFYAIEAVIFMTSLGLGWVACQSIFERISSN